MEKYLKMMKRKKEKIKYNENRVILSDVLPYELPIIFSNRYFYKFLTKYKIKLVRENSETYKLTYQSDENLNDIQKEALKKIIEILFGKENGRLKKGNFVTIPFNFKILHKENDFRELTIIHPLNQLHLVWFYNEYKDTIRYYCNISKYSIRKPYKIAKYKIKKDSLFEKLQSKNEKNEIIEESSKEYESLRSYFTYKKYSNIHKFFESYQYQRAEKKFDSMFKFDISKCFDSIYTHSICWAIYNKDIVKEVLNKAKGDFGNTFDECMQNLNYGETHGIVIGPEFSRIFAEIILQKIDDNVYQKLKKEEKYHKKDYEIYRYVDDFFVFFNDEKVKEKIFENYKHALKEYKLYINENKTIFYSKPIITELTIAKIKISKLLEEKLTLNIEKNDEKVKLNFNLKAQKLITDYKTIIKETDVSYKDILNWTFAIIDKKVKNALVKFTKLENKNQYEDKFTIFLLEILEFTFFIYATFPRVNTTIKISSILIAIINTIKIHKILSYDSKHIIFKKISEEIIFILNKYKIKKYTQIETSYLLLILSEMGKFYRIDKEKLKGYFDLKDQNNLLNYISIIILLYYIKNIKRYEELKVFIKEQILRHFNNGIDFKKNTESILLFFDIISCPFLDKPFKKELLKKVKITDENLQDTILNFEKYWFVKWLNLNYTKELQTKKSTEVYS